MRVLIYDKTERRPIGWTWRAASLAYNAAGCFDHVLGAECWAQIPGWLYAKSQAADANIAEVHVWGHGTPGKARLGGDVLDYRRTELFTLLDRGGVLSFDSLFWLRTGSSFHGHDGLHFAYKLAHALKCRVAGHTHRIGAWHSGLHSLWPQTDAGWNPSEGRGDSGKPLGSAPWRPRTISCLCNRIPEEW